MVVIMLATFRSVSLRAVHAFANHRVLMLVMVILLMNGGLLFRMGILCAVVTTLVRRQRRWPRHVMPIPVIPAGVRACPTRAQVLTPVRRLISTPAMEIRRRPAVIADRDTPQERRNRVHCRRGW